MQAVWIRRYSKNQVLEEAHGPSALQQVLEELALQAKSQWCTGAASPAGLLAPTRPCLRRSELQLRQRWLWLWLWLWHRLHVGAEAADLQLHGIFVGRSFRCLTELEMPFSCG
ncbi:hypothetical protein B9Z51_02730 [Limnohabitans sp. T6-5]|nr:hypothetical protein B9Z51_02730 [Limnohabitans sp. T6-5]